MLHNYIYTFYICITNKFYFKNLMNEQNWKNKFNSCSQVATTRITKLLMTTLSISIIYKDTWFVDFGTSQYLTFQKKVFPTFEKFILSHKIYYKSNSMFDVCRKDIIISTCQMGFPNVLEMCCMFQSWQKICYRLVN
jgi:hypothetical protein